MNCNKNKINAYTQNIPICLVPGPTGATGPTGSVEPNPYNLYVQSSALANGDGSEKTFSNYRRSIKRS